MAFTFQIEDTYKDFNVGFYLKPSHLSNVGLSNNLCMWQIVYMIV